MSPKWPSMVLTLTLVAALFPAFSWAAEESAASEDADKVVARVGKETITQGELDKAIGAATPPQMLGLDEEAAPQADPARILNALIDTRVLHMMAAEADFSVTDEEFQTMWDRVRQQAPDEEQFQAFLKQQNTTEEEFKQRLREQMVVGKFIREKVPQPEVTEEEVQTLYNEMKEQGRTKVPQVDVAHILVKVEGNDEALWDAAKEKIEAARKRIVDGGESFGDVAKEVSDDPGSKDRGGLYTDVGPGKMVPEFERAMFETPEGEVSEPFRTQFGWHILTPSNRRELEMPLERVERQLRSQIARSKHTKAVREMVEAKRKEMDVEILLPQQETPKQEIVVSPSTDVLLEKSS